MLPLWNLLLCGISFFNTSLLPYTTIYTNFEQDRKWGLLQSLHVSTNDLRASLCLEDLSTHHLRCGVPTPSPHASRVWTPTAQTAGLEGPTIVLMEMQSVLFSVWFRVWGI